MPLPPGGLDSRSPLSDIDHPIIRKAAESFGRDSGNDLHEGQIRGSRQIRLWEIRQSQWRGGVWVDEESGQPWLVVAGLAKGGHDDHDDFYQQVERADKSRASESWLPTEEDLKQLAREHAAALMVQWDRELQAATLAALESVVTGGEVQMDIPHPRGSESKLGVATLTVNLIREPGYDHDDLLLEVELAGAHKSSALGWHATTRLLRTINPNETAWDLGGAIYSPTPSVSRLSSRVDELRELERAGELAEWMPKTSAHYSHRRNLAEATVNGGGVRAMCGIYFVPTHDHEGLPTCDECDERYRALP